jgi:glycine betaine/proline transport system permease protein
MAGTVMQPTTSEPGGDTQPPNPQGAAALLAQLGMSRRVVAGLAGVVFVTLASWVIWGAEMAFPADWGKFIGGYVDDTVKWATREGAWLFDGIKLVVLKFLIWLEDIFIWIPWPGILAAVGMIAWKTQGWRLAAFSAGALGLIGLMGLWPSAMETLALIVTSVTLSIAIAVPIGILAARSTVADTVSRPILDGMQTMPAFVYLVPAIMFFSLGNVPAVFATLIYAVPPAIRLTNLGIRQVSAETVEAARSFGTTPTQLLLKVQIPMAIPTIMAGINQTTMMALAMVVVASMVGAGGLGEDVLRALGRQRPGDAVLGGLAIVFMAIIIDRITQSLAKGRQEAIRGADA